MEGGWGIRVCNCIIRFAQRELQCTLIMTSSHHNIATMPYILSMRKGQSGLVFILIFLMEKKQSNYTLNSPFITGVTVKLVRM